MKGCKVVLLTTLYTTCPKVQTFLRLRFWLVNLYFLPNPKPSLLSNLDLTTSALLAPLLETEIFHLYTLTPVNSFLLSTCFDFSCYLTRFLNAIVTHLSGGTDIDHPYIQQRLPLLPIMVIFCLLNWTLHQICVVKTEVFTSNAPKCYLLSGCLWLYLIPMWFSVMLITDSLSHTLMF